MLPYLIAKIWSLSGFESVIEHLTLSSDFLIQRSMPRIFLSLHQADLLVLEFLSRIAKYQDGLALTVVNYSEAGQISAAQHHFSKDFNISHKDHHITSQEY